MKKIIYEKYGSLSNLHMADVAALSPGASTLIVQVKAVSINPLDWKIVQGDMKMMMGKTFPKGIGFDFSGVVSHVGSSVSGFAVGDAVMGAVNAMKGPGALAEFVQVHPHQVVHKPTGLSFEQASALPIVGAAALQSLTKVLRMQSGQRLLINGATGGVGMIATQIAHRMGIYVTAVVSSKGVDLAQKWGATRVINYQTQSVQDLTERFDAILDLSTKLPFAQAKMLLTPTGLYVNFVPTLKDILLTPFANLLRGQKVKLLMSSPDQATLHSLTQYASQGLDVHISQRFNWTDFANAYEQVRQKGVLGKAVLVVADSV
ncbi:MAG: NAD(P)-dependent alcohol dehydrogenase [Deltaproteobacteria bacterium]|nr:NAD(P)-dependent alcohol dehydrogenase [Deltaproteobacteria bacterium]